WTRNIDRFDVECAFVPKEKVVKLLTSAMDYDPWYDPQNDQPLDWDGLGLKQKKTSLGVREDKNKWHLTNLGMKDLCGGATTRGLSLAEIKSDQPPPPKDDERTWGFHPPQRVLANVTELGVLLKVGPASGLVWVTSLKDGKPVSGASVTVYSLKGDVIA